MTPIAAVGEVAEAVADVSKEVTQRDAEENTPQMQIAKLAAEVQALKERVEQHIANKDLHALQQDAS